MAAVEFALIAPIMVLLYLGGTELTRAIAIDRKVSLAARVASDLVARSSTVLTDANLTVVCQGALAMLAPYPSNKLSVTLTSVVTDSAGKSTVGWSRKFSAGDCATSTAARSTGETVNLPTGIAVNGASVIWAETGYEYEAMFDIVVKTGIMQLKEASFMRPRLLSKICYKSC